MTGDEKIPLHRLDENEATKAVTEEPPIYSKKSFLKKTIQNFMLCEELRRIRQYQGTGHDLSPGKLKASWLKLYKGHESERLILYLSLEFRQTGLSKKNRPRTRRLIRVYTVCHSSSKTNRQLVK